MLQEKRCIFHYPNPIDFDAAVGSAVRPLNMYNAFKEIGYIVDDVSGYGAERRKKIAEIKRNISEGIQYEFIYSESLTFPSVLSEKNHFPRYPFLDYSFFKFCKKRGIKIGLFYRDIFWKFPFYKESVKKWVPIVTVPFFKYDETKYRRLLDILYVPSEKFMDYVDLDIKWKPMPSGGKNMVEFMSREKQEESDILTLFYVGGVAALNDITELVRTVSRVRNIELIICCPQDAWETNKEMYHDIMGNNVMVVHESGDTLKRYYDKADVACLYFSNNEYRDLAMPVKLFEYIGYGKPVISNSGTAAAHYIQDNELGWIVDYGTDDLKNLLLELSDNRKLIREKAENVRSAASYNTWKERALQVEKDLKSIIEEVNYGE